MIPPNLREAAEAAAKDDSGSEDSYVAGVEWLYAHLLSQGGAELAVSKRTPKSSERCILAQREEIERLETELAEAKAIISGKTFSYPPDYQQLKADGEALARIHAMTDCDLYRERKINRVLTEALEWIDGKDETKYAPKYYEQVLEDNTVIPTYYEVVNEALARAAEIRKGRE